MKKHIAKHTLNFLSDLASVIALFVLAVIVASL